MTDRLIDPEGMAYSYDRRTAADDPIARLETLRKGWMRQRKLLTKAFSHIILDLGRSGDDGLIEVDVGETKIKVPVSALRPYMAELDALIDVADPPDLDPISYTKRQLQALKRLPRVISSEPALRSLAAAFKDHASRIERALPDASSAVEAAAQAVADMEAQGLLDDTTLAKVKKSLKNARSYLRNDYLMPLVAVADLALLVRKARRSKVEVNWCPGSGKSMSLSVGEIMDGSTRCPYCGQGVAISSRIKRNEDYSRTLPRHKYVPRSR